MTDDTLPAALQEALDADVERLDYDGISYFGHRGDLERRDRARAMAAALRWAWLAESFYQIPDAVAALERAGQREGA